MESLRGALLVAAPSLLDPNFQRTVVLVTEHTDEGAMGLVLNRPTETTVEEAAPELSPLTGPAERVHQGGPVQPGTETLRGRVYAGYAGWGPGQLESELEEEGWIVVEHPLPDELFSPGPDALWHDVLERQGGHLALIARM